MSTTFPIEFYGGPFDGKLFDFEDIGFGLPMVIILPYIPDQSDDDLVKKGFTSLADNYERHAYRRSTKTNGVYLYRWHGIAEHDTTKI